MNIQNLFGGYRKQTMMHLQNILLKKGGEIKTDTPVAIFVDDEKTTVTLKRLGFGEQGQLVFEFESDGDLYEDDFELCTLDEMYNILTAVQAQLK